MILKLLDPKDPKLRIPCEPVGDDVDRVLLKTNLLETMAKSRPFVLIQK